MLFSLTVNNQCFNHNFPGLIPCVCPLRATLVTRTRFERVMFDYRRLPNPCNLYHPSATDLSHFDFYSKISSTRNHFSYRNGVDVKFKVQRAKSKTLGDAILSRKCDPTAIEFQIWVFISRPVTCSESN